MLVVTNTVEMNRPLSGVSSLSDGTVIFDSVTQVRLQFKLQLNGAALPVTAPYPSLSIYNEDYQLLLTQPYTPGTSGWSEDNSGNGYIAIVINGASTALNSLQSANHKLYWRLTGRFGGLIEVTAVTGQMLFSRVSVLNIPPASVGVTRDYANLNDAYAAAAITSFAVNDYVYISGTNPYEAQKGVWKVITVPGTDISQYTRVLSVDLDTNYPVGPAGGDLGGTYPNPAVNQVGGVAANTVAAAGVAVASATALNVINTLVKRDGTGAIYATLHGTADSVPWSGVTVTPTTLTGYGITDAAPKGLVTASGLTSSSGKILGRTTAATGAVEELSAGTGITIAGGTVSVTASTYQPINTNLTGLAGLSGPGYAKWTGVNTVTMVATVPWSDVSGAPSFITGIAWGAITGTLSSQSDLNTALNGKQPLDGTLTALAALTGAGYARWTGTDTLGMVATIPWGDISGVPSYQPLDGTLTALAALATSVNTLILCSGTDTFVVGQLSDPYISNTAAIGWSKISKSGAIPSDIGAVAPGVITGSGLTVSTARLLGRTTAATGAIEEISVGAGLTLAAGVLSSAGGSVAWGNVTGTLSNQTDLSNALAAKAATGLATGSGLTISTARILGRTTAATGALEEISIGAGLTLSGGSLSASGSAPAWGTITGTLSSQTDLNTALNGKQPLATILTTLAALANASGVLRNNGSGTLSYDNTVTTQGNTFNGNTQLVQTTAGGALPALSAANLTSIPAGNLTGSVADARLSANVALYNGTSAFTQPQSISNAGAVLLSVTSTTAPSTGSGGFITLACNDGATAMGNTFRLGGALFTGRDSGGTSRNAAGIVAYAAENWTASAAGAYLTFETTNNTTNVRTAKLFISDFGSVGIGALPTSGQAMLVVPASTTANASLNIPVTGVAPTAPNNGDIWAVSTNLLVRLGGVSQSIVTGTGSANQISYWNAANTQSGNGGFTATATSGAILFTLGQTTTATGATNLASFTLTANPASAATGTYAAGDFTVSTTAAAGANYASNSLMAFRTTINANTSVSGTLTGVYGNRGVLNVLNSGISGTTWTIGSVYGYIADTSITTSTAGATTTINTYTAIHIPTPTFSGSGTNTITTRYAINQVDPASSNVFAGPTTVGTLASTVAQLIVQGGASGAPIIRLSRTSGGTATFAWALVGGGLSFTDEVAGFTTTNIFGDSNINQLYLGQRLVTASNTRACLLSATTFGPAAGTDVPGVSLILQGSLGTGAGATGSVIIRSAVVGTTGTATQATVDRITLVDGGFKLANSTGSGYNLQFSDGSNSFRSVASTSFTDSAAATFFQVGSVNGNASFTAQNGSVYGRVLFTASKFVIADTTVASVTVPSGLFEVYNSTPALRFRVNNVSGSAYVQTPASTTTNASINLPHGVPPTTPVDGDMWTATTGLYARINGATVGPYGTGGGGGASWGAITGTLSAQTDLQAELDAKASNVTSLVNALIFG